MWYVKRLDLKMAEKTKKTSAWLYILMLVNFVVYSLCLVFASWAGQFSLLSSAALIRYFIAFVLLGIYAILWQQVLKRIPLTIAYACRAVTVLLGMLWGAILFAEVITVSMGIGAGLVICGVILVAWR